MTNLLSITGMEYLNTSQVTYMSSMFYNCNKLESLDLSHFNTSLVTDMGSMFGNCQSLTTLDLSSFNTSNVTNMNGLFYNCHGLENLNVTSFNTSKLTSMYLMFSGCRQLESLDLSSFNIEKVTMLASMFTNCSKLKILDLTNFNTSKVTNMSQMFLYCGDLVTIYVGDGWSTAAVTSDGNMFYGCTNLVGGQGTTYDDSHVDKAYARIDGGPSNPGYFTDINAPAGPEAYACYTPDNTTLTFYYDKLRSTRPGTTYDLNEGMNAPAWEDYGSCYTSVTQVVFDPSFADARPTSMSSWFWGMTNLQSIDGMDCVNTEDVTTMWGLFTTCSSLTMIDLSSFNTSKVTNMLSMFADCSNLTTIYAGDGWSMASVNVTANMFANCTKLVGGMGTAYDPNFTNGYYAHIDGGPSNPGYFTAKVAFTRGDVNCDGQVRINDVTALIDYLLSGDATGISLDAADCNQDDQIRINDVTALIDFLLSGVW